jgi:hypothetical protein
VQCDTWQATRRQIGKDLTAGLQYYVEQMLDFGNYPNTFLAQFQDNTNMYVSLRYIF